MLNWRIDLESFQFGFCKFGHYFNFCI